MRKITADRFKLVSIISCATALALGTSWMVMVTNKKLWDEVTPQRTEPDYIIDKFSYVRMTSMGQAQYHLVGDKLTHFPIDDSSLIDRPIMTRYGKMGETQTMVSDTAVVEDENRKVHMYNNVVVDRPPFEKLEPMRLTTEYLLLLPDDDIMQTPNDVVITRGNNKLTGTGMFANNYTREFKLYEQTRVYIAPPDKSKK